MGRYEIKQRDRSPRSWYIWDNVKGGPVCDVFGNTCYFRTPKEAQETANYF